MGNQKKRKTSSRDQKEAGVIKEEVIECAQGNNTNQSIHVFTSVDVVQIRQSLLTWYDTNKRDLPWRNILTKDKNDRAYATWVSEIMLQQTQVATVIKYYNSWMKKWPTINSLASADIESVNEAWKGLGYYSRGRRLFEGAKKIMEELGGQMPNTAEDLQKKLPGVGRYTAGAIASIAFTQTTGLVDGNVIRVFARLRAIGGNSTQNDIVETFWSLAHQLVSPSRPGDLNQSLMELGATVCTPKTPVCSQCPVSSYCKAFAKVNQVKSTSAKKLCTDIKREENNEPDLVDIECLVPDCRLCLPSDEPWNKELGVMNFPRKPKKAKAREETLNVVILCRKCSDGEDKEQFLINKRPLKGLLAGLWEFPNEIQKENDKGSKKDVTKFISSILDIPKENIENLQLIGGVSHQFSHIHHTYKVWSGKLADGIDAGDSAQGTDTLKWVTRPQLKDTAIPTGMVKVFDMLKDPVADKKSLKRKKSEQCDIQIVEGNVKQRSISDFFKLKPH